MLDLQTEFVAVTQALHQAELDYAVCGGLAVAIHGAPRATRDIDLLVQEHDVPRVLEVLRPLGYRFTAPPMRFPDGMRIQRVSKVEDGELMTVDLLLVGDESEAAWRSRTRVQTGEGPVSVISRQALIGLKLWAGRPQDLADVDKLTHDDR